MCLAVVIRCVILQSSEDTLVVYIPPFFLMRAPIVAFSMRRNVRDRPWTELQQQKDGQECLLTI